MAFYEKFTGKKDPRDDWRDDEKTRRPKRDQAQTDSRSKDDRKMVHGPKKNDWNRGDHRRQDRMDGAQDRRFDERNQPAGKGMPHADRRENERGHGKSHEHGRDGGQGKYPRENRRPSEDRYPTERDHAVREYGQEQEMENLLAGRNPIREALKTGRDMEKLLVARGELMGSAREIVAMAREQHIVVQEVDRARLDAMVPGHQGMVAVVSAYKYHTLDDIFARAAEREEEPFIVMLDGIMDPHNLGAIIRSAECAGAHGVIIPTRRAVGLTPAAVKASAGAVEHIPVVRETNLSRTLEYLKKEGCWVFGTAMAGKHYRNADYSGPVVLVIGSEGDGISKLVADHCDDMVTIPMYGGIDSLNASVAAGIMLFTIAEKRGGK